jgi:hypothetical protein
MHWNPERVLVYRKSAEVTAPLAAAAAPTAATPSARRLRIGIWDLNATAGSLPHVLDAIEDAQSYLSFYSVEAAFQIGLTTPGDHVAAQWKLRTGGSMSRSEAAMNVCASPIFRAARPIREALRLDWLVIVVRSMIADETDPDDAWYNLFATTRGGLVLLSTYDLREFAAQAGRPFESAVAGTALSMVIQSMVPHLEATPGTIFDFCENRHDIVEVIRTPKIDSANRARIPAEILEPLDKILDVLKAYKGTTTPAQMRRQRKVLGQIARTPTTRKVGPVVSPPVTFQNLLKTLNASLPKPATKTRVAKKHTKKTAKRGK